MKIHFLLALLFLSLGCGIITFPKPISHEEIAKLESNSLHDLQLKVTTQTDGLRVDVIRQTETETDSEGNCETVDISYHHLGFDLGNGLFFDLNDNLSFRIDSLLGISQIEDFEILKIQPYSETTILRKNNVVCRNWNGLFAKNHVVCKDSIEYSLTGMKYFHKKNLRYELIQSEDETILSYNSLLSRSVRIIEEGNDYFVLKRRKNDDNFFLDENNINLRNKYLVHKNEDKNLIEIYSVGRKRNYLLYKIKKTKNKVIVYSKSNFGTKIDFSDSDVSITYNGNEKPTLSYQRLK